MQPVEDCRAMHTFFFSLTSSCSKLVVKAEAVLGCKLLQSGHAKQGMMDERQISETSTSTRSKMQDYEVVLSLKIIA